jgi:hypothetical protein
MGRKNNQNSQHSQVRSEDMQLEQLKPRPLAEGEMLQSAELHGHGPNVIFVRTQTRLGKAIDSPAPTWRRSGVMVFNDLPSDEQQRSGFYYPRAAELIRAFPNSFKRFVKKGDQS